MTRHKNTILAILVVILAILAVGSMAILKFQPTTPAHKHGAIFPAGHCVIDITHGETDGEPVVCMNTGKIGTQADYQTACYWNGSAVVGLEIFNTAKNSYTATACGSEIFPLPAYADHWQDAIFTTDGATITHAAWSGDSWVIVFGNGATYAGSSPDMVAYLRDIQSAAQIASMGQAGGYPSK